MYNKIKIRRKVLKLTRKKKKKANKNVKKITQK